MIFKEKRREKRYSPNLTCTILPNSEPMDVLDVSLHGMSIISDLVFSEGDLLDIQVELISVGYITVGVIIRNVTKLRGKNRYGLEINTIPEPWINFVYRLMFESDQ